VLNKKALLPLLLSLLLVVSLVGCSSSSQETSSKKAATTKIDKTVSDKAKTNGAGQTKTAPGAAPAMKNGAGTGAADGTRIIGQIVSVKGRTVTLALFNMPSAPESSSGNSTSPSAPPAGGTPPSGGNQAGGQGPQLSGEKKTIAIPAAVKIYSGGRDSSSEVSISDLKVGQMMQVLLNSSTSAIESVRVMEEGQGGPPARGNGPGQSNSTSAN